MEIKPFKISINSKQIQDLQRRLENCKLPPQEIVPNVGKLEYGITLNRMKELIEKWQSFLKNWQDKEVQLNSYPNFQTEIESINLHFIHLKSPEAIARPLILLHGWPGSFIEFVTPELIEILTNPSKVGLTGPAFHLVIPSLPGFTFSTFQSNAKQPWTMRDTSRVLNHLMIGLGYEEYAAQGGDWGSLVARCLGSLYPDHCKAVHINFCPVSPPFPFSLMPVHPKLIEYNPLLTTREKRNVLRTLSIQSKDFAYVQIQGSKPATLAFGLLDSPVGLLAWIGEKFEHWIDKDTPHSSLTDEHLLLNISLYWFTESIATSFLPYKHTDFLAEILLHPLNFTPFGYSEFPSEIILVPIKWIAKTGKLEWTKEHDYGGHFAALECPKTLSHDIRNCFNQIWT